MEFKVVAKYTYTAKRPDELSFQKKEILTVLDMRDNQGWWLAKNDGGECKIIPSNYVLVLEEKPKETSKPEEVPMPVVVAASKPPEPEKETFESDWERRAVVAERNLTELLSSIARDRLENDALVARAHERAVLAEQQTRDAEERALELARRLEQQAAQPEETHSDENVASEQVAELLARVAELEDEREAHREASIRATELFDKYEIARGAVDQLQQQLAQARQEADDVRAEMKDLKRKTARMVALFNDQKKEMESRLDNAVSSQSDVHQLEAQRLKDKHLIENLRDEIASLKERLKQQEQQQARVYEPPPAPFLPVAAPPPPPPPPPTNRPTKSSVASGSSGGPTCPKCRRAFEKYEDFYGHEPCPGAGVAAAIQGGVSLKKTPGPAPASTKAPPVEKKPGGQGSFAEMAAAIAKQRAERAKGDGAAPAAKRDSARHELDKKIFLIRNSLRDD